MTSTTPDRRIQRTRTALHDALLSLILEKRYEKITVQDIIDRADVGRSTFYAHFRDKDDLLVQGMAIFSADLDAELADAHDLALASGRPADHPGEEAGHILHSLPFFQHAAQHPALYRAVLDGGGAEVILEAGRRHMALDIQSHLAARFPDGPPPEIPIEVIINFLAGALQSVLVGWLEAGCRVSPEAINATFQQLASYGVAPLLDERPWRPGTP